MPKITYEDKSDIRITLESPKNKVSASDLNMIKNVVNSLSDLSTFNTLGWTAFADNATPQTIGNTYEEIIIDGIDGSITDYKPLNAVGNLYDIANNKIQPETIGDAYIIRLSFSISAKTTNPNYLEIAIDISDNPTMDNIITTIDAPLYKNPPFEVNVTIPIYTLDTFVQNGGKIYAKTDTGSIDIIRREIFIQRVYSNA